MRHTLSKSDFKLAQSCETKLYYKEMGYPQREDGDPYLDMLAEGGYMVEQLARLMFPEGRELAYGRDPVLDAAETATAMKAREVTLFEATLLSGKKLARVDILRKKGNRIELIEVKSISFDGSELDENEASPFRQKRKPYAIIGKWQSYLEDVTFQVHVLKELYPDYKVTPYLILVDNSKMTSMEGLPGMFDVRREVEIGGRMKDLDVRFTGDPASFDPGEFLAKIDVSSEVAELLPAVAESAEQFAALLKKSGPLKAPPVLTWDCKGCEFRNAEGDRDGFRECWGKLAEPDPHIFDLYHFSSVRLGKERLADVMIQAGETGMYQINLARLVKEDETPAAYSFRQEIQIRHTQNDTPWIGAELAGELKRWKWPLHFIDFETTASAIPYHAGLHPYETIGFQWSCHTLSGPKAKPDHSEWLNSGSSWPCLEFAKTLREAIGEDGTVLMWANHERTVLEKIHDQMVRFKVGDKALRAWLRRLTDKASNSPRLVDLNRLCEKQFFHPGMKGKTSIKVVLDTLWKADPSLRAQYTQWTGRAGDPKVGPYEALQPLHIDGVELNVSEGTGAMRAYQTMLYSAQKHDPRVVTAWRELLLRYCELDTLAMVLIWDHWRRVTG